MKDHIDRNTAIIGWLSGIGIPLSILLAGWLVSSTVESSKLDYEYVKIAISIIASGNSQSDSKELQEDEIAIRKWAIRLLNEKAPEKLTKAEQDALMRSPQALRIKWMSDLGPIEITTGPGLAPDELPAPSDSEKIPFKSGTNF